MSKRHREESLVDPSSGETLRGDELFADKQRLLLILEQMDHRTVSAFEQASKRAREFVQGRHVWRTLFQRDYLEIFHNAGGNNMSDEIKKKIDGYTVFDRKRREETYWKRYYEFLKKSEESLQEFGLFTRGRLHPLNWRRTEGVRFMTPRGNPQFHEYVNHEWRFRHDSINDILYYYPFFVDHSTGTDIPESQQHPEYAIAFSMAMENVPSYNIIPWDPSIETFKIINVGSPMGPVYVRSKDGFYWVRIHGMWLEQLKPSYPLVSQPLECSICSETTTKLLHSCECCGEIYCGRECQKVNH